MLNQFSRTQLLYGEDIMGRLASSWINSICAFCSRIDHSR